MKVLKSGIEMTKDELKKVKGGLCSCGCGIRFSAMNVNVVGEDYGICTCGGCTIGDPENAASNASGAQIQPG